jgi:LysM repeat protein
MLATYKLESPRKLVRALLIVLAVFAATILPFSANASSDQVAVEFTYVTVSAGDSMWDLASKYGHGMDPRDWIADAVALNNLQSTNLQAGQQLALP